MLHKSQIASHKCLEILSTTPTDGFKVLCSLCGKQVKVIFTNVIHVTCVTHMISRVTSKIASNEKDISMLVLFPTPVATRFGTWLNGSVLFG